MKRTYVGEMAWAIEQAMLSNHDRNSNRFAQVDGLLRYGFSVELARRDHLPIPERPEITKLI